MADKTAAESPRPRYFKVSNAKPVLRGGELRVRAVDGMRDDAKPKRTYIVRGVEGTWDTESECGWALEVWDPQAPRRIYPLTNISAVDQPRYSFEIGRKRGTNWPQYRYFNGATALRIYEAFYKERE